MKYYSTHHRSDPATFREATLKGLPDDNGLYMPEHIPSLNPDFFDNLSDASLADIGYEVMKPYTGNDLSGETLRAILNDTFAFDIPMVKVQDHCYALELHHGPTLAFKDVGARFLARTLSHFHSGESSSLKVLVATSGDTGSAVANGFHQVPGIEVIVLYPTGRISDFQELQMTTLGDNIHALEVEGTFDDCQDLVKKAFLDRNLNEQVMLTSANSINISRMLPQSIYYFHALGRLPESAKDENLIISVPSGNFGNLTAGLIAKHMGLPVHKYLACTNINDIVPQYLETGQFKPKPSLQTLSNAMDVGNPSNFARMLDLYGESRQKMKEDIQGYRLDDAGTRQTIGKCYRENAYILDPHGAVAYAGLQEYLEAESGTGIFLETAHPYKFKEAVEEEIEVTLDEVIRFKETKKQSQSISADFDRLKEFLLN